MSEVVRWAALLPYMHAHVAWEKKSLYTRMFLFFQVIERHFGDSHSFPGCAAISTLVCWLDFSQHNKGTFVLYLISYYLKSVELSLNFEVSIIELDSLESRILLKPVRIRYHQTFETKSVWDCSACDQIVAFCCN